MFRCGIGYDVHRFVGGRPLILGGVEIPHVRGLDGHSDADVLCHAIADAVLGAMGERDIGHHYPPGEEETAGMCSLDILRGARRLLDAAGGALDNIDATVIAEAPKILRHVPAMKEAIGAALGIAPRRVGIKATTNEGMGFVGREEGIAALAVAAIRLPDED